MHNVRTKNSKNGSNLLHRKIQRLGASSLIVTLPKEWARRHGIKVGDILTLYDEGDKLVIAPNDESYKTRLKFNLGHTHVERHAKRLILCSYVFGFDEVTFYSQKTLKKEYIQKLKSMEELLPDINIEEDFNKVHVKMKHIGKEATLIDKLVEYGRLISRLYADYIEFLKGSRPLTREELEGKYKHLMKINYMLLRTANSVKSYNKAHERKCRYMVSASNLIGIIADSAYKLGLDLISMASRLSEDEKERLSFLLQLLEVALSTTVFSIRPPSVRKSEESYYKVRDILNMEGDLEEIITKSSPAFAYFVAKIMEIARIIEIAEHIMLCNALIEKYNEPEFVVENNRHTRYI